MQLEPGTIVDDKYEILAPLGMGGFGVVYKARQIAFDRVVALKVLHAHLDTANDAFQRFEREARALSLLRHRNLVIFYGFGVWQGSPYIAMEMVQGKSLQTVLNEEGSLPLIHVLYFMKQLCQALVCAHANGIVHRDIKPTNVMICESEGLEYLKVIDFGLAKILPGAGYNAQRLTEAGFTVGSAQYMSPEQCIGQAVDERSDVYSIACIIQRCISGSAPFEGEHSVVIMQQQLHEAPPLLSEVMEEGTYPPELQDILIKGLAKAPDDRYQSVQDMLSDLSSLSDEGSDLIAAHASPIFASSAKHRALELPKRRRFPSTVVLFGVLMIIAIGCSAMMMVNLMSATPTTELSIAYYKQASDMDAGDKRADHSQLLNLYGKAVQLNQADKRLSVDAQLRARSQVSRFLNEQRRFLEAKQVAEDGLNVGYENGIFGEVMASLCRNYGTACDELGFARSGVGVVARIRDHWPDKTDQNYFNVSSVLASMYRSRHDSKGALKIIEDVEKRVNPEDWIYFEIMTIKSLAQKDLGQREEAEISARKAEAARADDERRRKAVRMNTY